MGEIEFSAILPCFNEEENIAEVVRRIDASLAGLSHEIIVVDDGSTDGTKQEAMKLGVKVVSYAPNQGKGHAIIRGMREAKGIAVGYMDSDLDIDASELRRYIGALQHADIAIGSKRQAGSRVLGVTAQRLFLTASFHNLVRVVLGTQMADTQAGLKVLTKKAADRIFPLLRARGFGLDAEMLMVAHLQGMRITELPLTVRLGSHFSWRSTGLTILEILLIGYQLRVKHAYEVRLNNAPRGDGVYAGHR